LTPDYYFVHFDTVLRGEGYPHALERKLIEYGLRDSFRSKVAGLISVRVMIMIMSIITIIEEVSRQKWR